ncbi:hypothetical protein WPS_34100 [Vulcanimicrobium alpinum]|uniref:Transposase n=1 Tax=Vulcanimicrobium alpinum TaxID=3016050 RepID=A0AAN1XZC1_UNVUL|nr:hypothetical protein WPS_34100 [Vulcanimicrobium alpinum]
MADYDLTLSRDAIPALLDQPAALGKLVEVILNQVLEAQMRDHLGAERYQRCEEREGYRNGYRDRQLSTRVGSLVLRCRKRATAASQPTSLSVIAAANKPLSWA